MKEKGKRKKGNIDMTALGRQEEWEEPKGRADLEREARPDFA